jgi:hypothetical protein
MRAITLWQPWGSQVFDKVDPKDVENRATLRPPAELINEELASRPFFAIHAGLKYDPSPLLHQQGVGTGGWAYPEGARVPLQKEIPYGAVLGVARVRRAWDAKARVAFGIDSTKPLGDAAAALVLPKMRWWLGPIGWELMDAIPIRPVPCRGALGCWTLAPDVAREVAHRAAACVDQERDERAAGEDPNWLVKMKTEDLQRASEMLWKLVYA